MSKNKKQQQLGMNPSTAQHRLIKDIMWKLIVDSGLNQCFHCNNAMERDNFSVEHKKPWLDSENPVELFFDLDNISFSHLKCNVRAARKILSKCGTNGAYSRGCTCSACKAAHAARKRNQYDPEYRRSRYLANEKNKHISNPL